MNASNIIPLPKKIGYKLGFFEVVEPLRLFFASSDGRLLEAVEKLNIPFQREDDASKANISLLQEPLKRIPRVLSSSIREQAYEIEVSPADIKIRANALNGLFYGIQTLIQMFLDSRKIPCCVITDWPDMEFRGVHLTLGSGHMPPYEKLCELINKLAYFKINSFTLEYDNSFSWEKYPFIPQSMALSKDQCRGLIEVAEKNFMEIIPLVDSLGHQEYYLSHQELAHLRELPDFSAELCPSNPDSITFIKDLWTEVLEVHKNCRYVNITGDEVFRLDKFCGKCGEYAARGRLADLFFNYYNELAEWMLNQGRRPMMWHDMFVKHPERLKDYSRELIIIPWRYWGIDKPAWQEGTEGPAGIIYRDDVGRIPAELKDLYMSYWIHKSTAPCFTPWPYIRFFIDQGFEVIGASSGSGDTMDIPVPFPGFTPRIANPKSMAATIKEAGGKGLLNTFWTSNTSILAGWSSLAAGADFSWHSREEKISIFLDRFDRLYLGTGGKFRKLARHYDRFLWPENPAGFDVEKSIPNRKDEKRLAELMRDSLNSCKRNKEYLDLISPSTNLFPAVNELKRRSIASLTCEFESGRDVPIDISEAANGTYIRIAEKTGDRLSLKPGMQYPYGVEFKILPCDGDKRNIITLGGQKYPQGAEKISVMVNQKFDMLFFLHTGFFIQNNIQIAHYDVVFEDGKTETVPVKGNYNIGDWHKGAVILPIALLGWQGFSCEMEKVKHDLYLAWWKNPCPDLKIKQIRLVSEKAFGYMSLIALTGRIQDDSGSLQKKTKKRTQKHVAGTSENFDTFESKYRAAFKGKCIPEHIEKALKVFRLKIG